MVRTMKNAIIAGSILLLAAACVGELPTDEQIEQQVDAIA